MQREIMKYTFPETTIPPAKETYRDKLNKDLVVNAQHFAELVKPTQIKKSEPIDIPTLQQIPDLSWASWQLEENEHVEYEFETWVADSFW